MRRRLIVMTSAVVMMLTSFKCFFESESNHCFIRFANHADYAIYVCDNDFKNPHDTTPAYRFQSKLDCLKIEPNETDANSLIAYSWEEVFTDDKTFPTDTLMIFVFEAEKVETGADPQEAVVARYEVSLGDLQRNNWLLTYPPNGNMANIKMWPPYSSYGQAAR